MSDVPPDTEAIFMKVAALIAVDAPPASYAWRLTAVLESGATAEDLLRVLRAIAPQVGGPKIAAAAPEIVMAMGLELTDDSG